MSTTRTYMVLDEPVPNPRPDIQGRHVHDIRHMDHWEPGLWIIDTDWTRPVVRDTYTRLGSYGRLTDTDHGTSKLHQMLRQLSDKDPASYHVDACLLDVFKLTALKVGRRHVIEQLYLSMGIGAVRHLAEAVLANRDKEVE